MAGSSGFAISITASDKASQTFDALNKRIAALRAPADRFNKSLARFSDTTGITKMAEGVSTLGDRALGTARAIERMASPMAAITSAASIAGMVEFSRRWADAGNQIGKTSYQLNMPVDRLGALRGAARLAGSSAEAMDSSLQGLGQTLSAAHWGRDPAAISTLNALHIGFHGANGQARQASDALGDVADAISKYKDARTQTRILEQLGISPDMLPLLKNGRQGLEDFRKQAQQTGGVMTGQMVKAATAMNHAWTELGMAIEGVGNKIGNDWSGTVTNVLKASSRWIEGNQPLAASLTEIGALTAAIKPGAMLLRILGLAAFVPGAGTALVTAPLAAGYAAEKMGINLVGPGGYGTGDWGSRQTLDPGMYRNDQNGWWGQHAPSWLGGSSAKKNPADPNQLRTYFKSQGWSDPQIAGILGNYQGESGMDAANIGDQGASAGLGMWRGQRRGAFRLMFGHDVSEGTPLEQAKFTQWELTHTEKDAGDHLRAATSARDAGAIVSREYERPKDVGMNAALRGQYAVTWQQKFDAEPAPIAAPGQNVAAGTNGTDNSAPYPKPGDPVPGTIGQTYGADGTTGTTGPTGNVHVTVDLKGAHPGTTASATASGAATVSPPRVETSMAYAR